MPLTTPLLQKKEPTKNKKAVPMKAFNPSYGTYHQSESKQISHDMIDLVAAHTRNLLKLEELEEALSELSLETEKKPSFLFRLFCYTDNNEKIQDIKNQIRQLKTQLESAQATNEKTRLRDFIKTSSDALTASSLAAIEVFKSSRKKMIEKYESECLLAKAKKEKNKKTIASLQIKLSNIKLPWIGLPFSLNALEDYLQNVRDYPTKDLEGNPYSKLQLDKFYLQMKLVALYSKILINLLEKQAEFYSKENLLQPMEIHQQLKTYKALLAHVNFRLKIIKKKEEKDDLELEKVMADEGQIDRRLTS